jgi:hypothetical protein
LLVRRQLEEDKDAGQYGEAERGEVSAEEADLEEVPTAIASSLPSKRPLEGQLTRDAWETELARHIIALYARSMEVTNPKSPATSEARAVMQVSESILPVQLPLQQLQERQPQPEEKQRQRNAKQMPLPQVHHLQPEASNTVDVLPAGPTSRDRYMFKKRVRVPPKGQPVWFTGTGQVKAEWGMLQAGESIETQLPLLADQGALCFVCAACGWMVN